MIREYEKSCQPVEKFHARNMILPHYSQKAIIPEAMREYHVIVNRCDTLSLPEIQHLSVYTLVEW